MTFLKRNLAVKNYLTLEYFYFDGTEYYEKNTLDHYYNIRKEDLEICPSSYYKRIEKCEKCP